jgi:hypothetical protein
MDLIRDHIVIRISLDDWTVHRTYLLNLLNYR